LTVLNPPAFDDEGPTNLTVPLSFVDNAFKLTKEEPFSGAIVGQDGVYVQVFKNLLPSRLPDYKEVEFRVNSDFRSDQAVVLAQQGAVKFATFLTNGMATGETFSNLCTQSRVKPVDLPPFSLTSTNEPPGLEDRIPLQQLKDVAFGTPLSTVSPAVPVRDGAFIIYVQKEIPADEKLVKAEAPAYLASLRRDRQYAAFNTWMNYELQRDPAFIKILNDLYNDAVGRAGSFGQ
jgi:hypothetical protein